jgi:hypothetical protein
MKSERIIQNTFFAYRLLDREFANASVVKPEKRPDRKHQAGQIIQALIAGNYAKIAPRFLGRYQPFVSHSLWLYTVNNPFSNIYHNAFCIAQMCITHPV